MFGSDIVCPPPPVGDIVMLILPGCEIRFDTCSYLESTTCTPPIKVGVIVRFLYVLCVEGTILTCSDEGDCFSSSGSFRMCGQLAV
jgi:hypothetical protein